jgi:putative Mg2+ transporter-C (MgtC) family protein
MCDSGCAIQQFLQELNLINYMGPILVSMLFGGLIGIEREIHHKPAGLRTNILICMGAAVFTLIAQHIGKNTDAESRIIQGVITGVGFIGAGVLIHEQGNVHGLTTAATIWLVTAVGIACGARAYSIAVAVVIPTIVVLVGLQPYEQKLRKNSQINENKPIENKDLENN